MTYSEQQVYQYTQPIFSTLGDDLKWRFEPRLNAMLCEFSRDKNERIQQGISEHLPHLWDKKSIKKAPKALKDQLGKLAKLSNQQLIFSLPARETTPTLVALWWPWDHGGTYSVRLLALEQGYEITATKRNIFSTLKLLFSAK